MEKLSGLEVADFSGEEYEKLFVAAMDLGWDAHAFLKAREDGADTSSLIKGWFERQTGSGLPDFDQWNQLSSPDKKRILLEWLAGRQPEAQPALGVKLQSLVAEELGLAQDTADLKLCSAVNSPADTLYGVDGFFQFRGQMVTFDLTANAAKADSGIKYNKADELISCAPDDEHCLRVAARGIAHELKFKLERAEADHHQGARDPRLASQEERDKAIAARQEQLRRSRHIN